jgi:MHS family proline/betaine transporter-like MFS transporter
MKLNKNLLIGLFSCSIESYTASIYVFAGPELKSQIFPYLSPDAATFFHYLIIALGLLCYPLGGYLFGFLGDKLGRKKALTYSSLGLAISTGLLGLVPLGFTGLFIYIPAILFTGLFCLQHFCSGGDYSSSAIFTVEHVDSAANKNLIYFSALACVMSVLGLILGQFMGGSGYWRLGCLSGFIGAIFAYFIRKQSEETPIFTNNHPPLENLYPRKFEQIIIFIFAGFLCSVYYFIFIFLTPHLFVPQGYEIRNVNICYFILYAISLWVGGVIISKDDLFKTVQDFSFILLLLLIQFGLILSQLDLDNLTALSTASVLIGFLVMFLGFIIAPQHALYLKLFPQRIRCQAIITSFTLGAAIIGGITPFLCKLTYSLTNNLGVTALWPAACTAALLTSLIIYNSKRTLNMGRSTPSKPCEE